MSSILIPATGKKDFFLKSFFFFVPNRIIGLYPMLQVLVPANCESEKG